MHILIININNIFKVQGLTEPYYVYNHLKKDHTVSLLTTKDDYYPDNHDSGFVKYIRNIPFIPHTIWFNIAAVFTLMFRAKSCDIIYCYKSIFLIPLIYRIFSSKTIVYDLRAAPVEQDYEFVMINKKSNMLRRLIFALRKKLYNMTLKRCDIVICVSEGVRQILVDNYALQADNIYIQPLGVDLDLFKPIEQSDTSGVHIGCVTSIRKQRRIDIVLKAVKHLKEKEGKVHLKIIGAGDKDTISQLKHLAEDLGIDDVVTWKGYVQHHKVPSVLKDCDICLSPLPDLQSYQISSPTKVFEYLAMRKIVIASDIEAHRKIIQHGINGILFAAGDSSDLAEKIITVIHDASLYKNLYKNSRKSVEKYSWDNMLPELEKHITKNRENI